MGVPREVISNIYTKIFSCLSRLKNSAVKFILENMWFSLFFFFFFFFFFFVMRITSHLSGLKAISHSCSQIASLVTSL